MSMISELVDRLRTESKSMGKYGTDYMATLLMQASDTIIMLSEKARADRPQGEWIRTGRTNIYGGIEVQCSNCGDKVMVQHLEDEWYCRHCGADMGMKGADDEV